DDFNQREGEREKEKEEREKEELKTREMGKCEAEEKEKREISEAWEKEKEMNLEDLLESLEVGKRRSADEPMENNNEAWGLTKDGTPLDNKGIIKPLEEALPKVYYGSTPKGVRGVDYREYVDNLIEELDGTHDKEREEVREH
ncbi:hypothetical protein ADUPG1_003390, partial [Aduncisulcus paluster]